MNDSPIYNPQLEGDPFIWEGGPTGVLLIHGYTATTAEVRPLARILHQQGYTVADPLLPGHNTRPDDANRYRLYPLKGARELLCLQRQVSGRLAHINQPILIVQGRLDATIDPTAAETVHREVRSAVKELDWMPNSQHCVIIDREREQVKQLTLDFLRRVDA